MIHTQHFPFERLYKRGHFQVEDFRKKEVSEQREYGDEPQPARMKT